MSFLPVKIMMVICLVTVKPEFFFCFFNLERIFYTHEIQHLQILWTSHSFWINKNVKSFCRTLFLINDITIFQSHLSGQFLQKTPDHLCLVLWLFRTQLSSTSYFIHQSRGPTEYIPYSLYDIIHRKSSKSRSLFNCIFDMKFSLIFSFAFLNLFFNWRKIAW